MKYIGYRPKANDEGKVDDLIILVRKRRWILSLLFFWAAPFLTKGMRGSLYFIMDPETTVRSAINEVEWGIIEDWEKIRKKLASLKVLTDSLEKEIKNELGSREYDRVSGDCEPFPVDDKVFKDLVKPYSERPPGRWWQFLNQMVIREFNLDRKPIDPNNPFNPQPGRPSSSNQGRGGIVPGEGGGEIGVILPEHQHLAKHLRDGKMEVDQFVTHKDPDKKQGGGGSDMKSQKRQIRQNNPFDPSRWENEKEWNKWVDDQWNEQHGNRDNH